MECQLSVFSLVSLRPDPAQHPDSPGAQRSEDGLDVLLLSTVGQGATLGEAQVTLQPPLRADGEEADVKVEGRRGGGGVGGGGGGRGGGRGLHSDDPVRETKGE